MFVRLYLRQFLGDTLGQFSLFEIEGAVITEQKSTLAFFFSRFLHRFFFLIDFPKDNDGALLAPADASAKLISLRSTRMARCTCSRIRENG
jgi:hypothetical protein